MNFDEYHIDAILEKQCRRTNGSLYVSHIIPIPNLWMLKACGC
jgi:hypothetical protein